MNHAHLHQTDGPKKKKVLIIDDDQRLAHSLERWLRANNYECLSVTDPEECFRAIGKQQPDLILLDLDMPKISGLGLLRKIRQDSFLKNTRVVVLTGISNEEIAQTVMDLGATAYLVKTYILQDLVPLIGEYI